MSVELHNSCLEDRHVRAKSIREIFSHELMHHLPYGTLSVSLALMVISLISVLFGMSSLCSHHHVHDHVGVTCCALSGMDILFHSFHFAHILFAASGTMVTFYRYSSNAIAGILVGIVSSVVFCTLADILLPYTAGRLLGVDMDLHICFSSELANIVPFLAVGVINGVIIPCGKDGHTSTHSISLHIIHTFISSMASVFYAIGHGLQNFHDYLGMFFVLMLIAVVLPCTLSDVVVPILCARMVNKK